MSPFTNASGQPYQPPSVTYAPGIDAGGIDPVLRGHLDELAREHRLRVISGMRTPDRNAAVGGASNSRHLDGTAVDIDTSGMTPQQREALLRAITARQGIGGVGIYPNSIHIDTRPQRTAWGPDYTARTMAQAASPQEAALIQQWLAAGGQPAPAAPRFAPEDRPAPFPPTARPSPAAAPVQDQGGWRRVGDLPPEQPASPAGGGWRRVGEVRGMVPSPEGSTPPTLPPGSTPLAVPADAPVITVRPDPASPARQFGREFFTRMRPPATGLPLSAAVGGLQGLTFGFGDELLGGAAAAVQGAVMAPIDYFRGGRAGLDRTAERASETYSNVRDFTRGVTDRAREDDPIGAYGGEIAGAIAPAVFAAPVAGAGLIARGLGTVGTGAALGALGGFGSGEGVENRVQGAAIGGALGGAASAAAAPLGALFRGVRARLSPEQNAANMIASALSRDGTSVEDVAQRLAQSRAVSQADDAAGRVPSDPRVVADMGRRDTTRLLRTAVNESARSQNAVEDVLMPRAQAQADRIIQAVSDEVPPMAGDEMSEAIRAASRAKTNAIYSRAYTAPGAQEMWDPTLEAITGADAVREAIRRALRTGTNRAVAGGNQPFPRPFAVAEDGTLSPVVRPDGSVARPSLQFWDEVKRGLDASEAKAIRDGDRALARDVGELRRMLVRHLDERVPEYAAARATAQRFFGHDEAATGGAAFYAANPRVEDIREMRRTMRTWSADDRALFRASYAQAMIDDLRRLGDSRDVVKRIATSPAAREAIEMGLGRNGFDRLTAALDVEKIMQRTYAETGSNSTTARQLTDAMRLGGEISREAVSSVPGAAFAITRGILRSVEGNVRERTYDRVAQLMLSNDPADLRRLLDMAQRSAAIRTMLARAAAASGAGASAPLNLEGEAP